MRKYKHLALVACLCAIVCTPAPAYGQRVWEKKPYQQWSFRDALKILTDSPWAQTEDMLKEGALFSDNPQAQLRVQNDPFPSFLATSVRLRSALPIRQAFVRQRQIGIKYDKLGAAAKAEFDAEAKEFLECPPCAKYYIVTVDSSFLDSRNRTFTMGYPLDRLSAQTYLANDNGQWRKCAHARQENREVLFFFQKRNEQGEPIITAENKEFYFTMSGQVSEAKLKAATYYAFDVNKITLSGEIIF